MRRLIRDHPWATIVSHHDGGLVASHYPVLLDEERDDLAVVTHVGRPDEQVHGFGAAEMLLIVAGPARLHLAELVRGPARPGADVELQRRALLRRAGAARPEENLAC